MLPPLFLSGAATNPAAGDPVTGISGRLGAEIVRVTVDNDRAADNIPQAEPLGLEYQKGSSAAG